MGTMSARQVVGNGTLLAMVDGTNYTVSTEHPNYKVLKEAFNEKDADKFLANLDVIQKAIDAVKSVSTTNRVVVNSDGVFIDGTPVHNTVSTAIMRLLRGGFDFAPMVKFLERVLQNPSKRSVEQLWTFLEVNGLMLTEDGCFLAYKSVKSNYLDKYSGKFDNKPGAVLRMDRNQVDDDFTRHCSTGFHVGALEYSGPNGWYHDSSDRVIICKVAPEDVVSVPNDHSCQKLRTCAYTVVGDYKAPLSSPLYSGKVGDSYDAVSVVNEDDYVEPASPWDMLVNHTYEFTYVDNEGNENTRVGVVVNNNTDDELVTCVMSSGDKSSGQYRAFRYDYMDNVREVPNGVKF